MAQNKFPFLRIEILKFQIHSSRTAIDLHEVNTEVEIKEKNDPRQAPRIKNPGFSESHQSILFDAGLYANVEREIFIRIFYNNVLYTFESDIKALQKLANGMRHQLKFSPKALADIIIEYKDPSTAKDSTLQSPPNGQRFAERYQLVYKHFDHKFVAKACKTPMFCSFCNELLWGFALKGFQCQRCGCVVHKDCYKNIVHPCSGKKYSSLVEEKPHQFEHVPFSLQAIFCDHDGSFIKPGHAFRCTKCTVIVHRRCQSKLGNYCGLEEENPELYEIWKKKHSSDPDNLYEYNANLCEIYTNIDKFKDTSEVKSVVDRITRIHRPKITSSVDLTRFQIIETLGFGMSASVYLVKRDESYYALKAIRKNFVLDGNNLSYVQSEREILIQTQSCPFVVKLFSAFQNVDRLFFLMEVAQVGNLFEILEMQAPRPFKQERIVFYAGEVACAIQFLHSKRIIYRDLKPENILVFRDGHVKISDMGLSKQNIDENRKTNTMCGTAEYIAYEIYHRDPYDQNVDWWTLGILIYELSTFTTPFYASNSAKVTERVLSKQFSYPECVPRETRQIIDGLLEPNPKQRLGNIKSPHGLLTNQPFFREPYTLDAIANFRVSPPWIPTSIRPMKSTGRAAKFSDLSMKETILLLSAPADTFRNFSYINHDAFTP